MSFATPIHYPVQLFSATDADAPQYTGAAGDILTIIKACLVTGYGSTASAGWTALYEDEGKITLQRPAAAGTHYVLQIHDSTQSAAWRVQDNPTDIHDAQNIVNTLPNPGFRLQDFGGLRYAPRWHVIACERAFLLYVEVGEAARYSAQNRGVCYYFGDVMSGDQTQYLMTHLPRGDTDNNITS